MERVAGMRQHFELEAVLAAAVVLDTRLVLANEGNIPDGGQGLEVTVGLAGHMRAIEALPSGKW